MTTYLYPHNLKAKANMWLWCLRDFTILGVAALLSVVLLVQFGTVLPAVATVCYGILSIRTDEMTVLDFLSCAVRFFFAVQQTYEWR